MVELLAVVSVVVRVGQGRADVFLCMIDTTVHCAVQAAATGTVFFKLYVIDEPPNPNISTFRPLPMQVEPCGALLEIFRLN